jgi:hypothetical protein
LLDTVVSSTSMLLEGSAIFHGRVSTLTWAPMQALSTGSELLSAAAALALGGLRAFSTLGPKISRSSAMISVFFPAPGGP